MTPVIVGAGLAGLSTAYHLGGRCRVFEKHERPGGLCRSEPLGAFVFDYSGHLLHFRTNYARHLVAGLLEGNLAVHRRRSSVHMRGRTIPYPLQLNLSGLPTALTAEYLEGFREANRIRPKSCRWRSFDEWARRTFGDAMAEGFFIPYNSKFWRVPLDELDFAWAERFIPVPTLEQVEAGAVGGKVTDVGYNAEFAYPECGNIEALARAFLTFAGEVRMGCNVVRVSLRDRVLILEGGEEIPYRWLVSTIPLPELVHIMAEEAPASVTEAARHLRGTCVLNVNLGIRRAPAESWHWTYFCEGEYVFYRVGFYSNFSNRVSPAGMGSLYAEVSCDPLEPVDNGELVRVVTRDLVRAGILESVGEVVAALVQRIYPAYVICDKHRRERVGTILDFLEGNGILSIGRYGRWEYMTMEDAIIDGAAAASRLLNGSGGLMP